MVYMYTAQWKGEELRQVCGQFQDSVMHYVYGWWMLFLVGFYRPTASTVTESAVIMHPEQQRLRVHCTLYTLPRQMYAHPLLLCIHYTVHTQHINSETHSPESKSVSIANVDWRLLSLARCVCFFSCLRIGRWRHQLEKSSVLSCLSSRNVIFGRCTVAILSGPDARCPVYCSTRLQPTLHNDSATRASAFVDETVLSIAVNDWRCSPTAAYCHFTSSFSMRSSRMRLTTPLNPP